LHYQKYLFDAMRENIIQDTLYDHIRLNDFVICRQQNCRAMRLAVRCWIDNRAKKQLFALLRPARRPVL